jgi:hypothetical protein
MNWRSPTIGRDDLLPKSEESKDEHNNHDQTDQIDDGIHRCLLLRKSFNA